MNLVKRCKVWKFFLREIGQADWFRVSPPLITKKEPPYRQLEFIMLAFEKLGPVCQFLIQS